MSIQGLMERIVGFARFSIYETLANYRAERRRVRTAIQREAHDVDEFIRNKLWETTYDDRKRLKVIELICDLRFQQHDYHSFGTRGGGCGGGGKCGLWCGGHCNGTDPRTNVIPSSLEFDMGFVFSSSHEVDNLQDTHLCLAVLLTKHSVSESTLYYRFCSKLQ